MKIQKCFFCNKTGPTPYHVTEIEGKKVEFFDMCPNCAVSYLLSINGEKKAKPESALDLSSIQTPEDILSFINSLCGPASITKESCQCGTTPEDIEGSGRFGCAHCYEHFNEFMENIVYPFHGANKHAGKIPRNAMQNVIEKDPIEKMKLLKLRYAKAIELEEYEKAAKINEEIKQLQSLPSFSVDQ